MGTTDNKTKYSAKAGLMYVSDYEYAATSSAWTSTMNSYNYASINWMYIRPSFFLSSSVTYEFGNGSISEPFRISV